MHSLSSLSFPTCKQVVQGQNETPGPPESQPVQTPPSARAHSSSGRVTRNGQLPKGVVGRATAVLGLDGRPAQPPHTAIPGPGARSSASAPTGARACRGRHRHGPAACCAGRPPGLHTAPGGDTDQSRVPSRRAVTVKAQVACLLYPHWLWDAGRQPGGTAVAGQGAGTGQGGHTTPEQTHP